MDKKLNNLLSEYKYNYLLLAFLSFFIFLTVPVIAQRPDSSVQQTQIDDLYARYNDLMSAAEADSLLVEIDALKDNLVRQGFGVSAEHAHLFYIHGLVQNKFSRYSQAESSFLESKEVYDSLGDKNNEVYMKCLQKLGNYALDGGKYVEAVHFLQRYDELVEILLGRNHERFVYSKMLLAEAYSSTGEFQKAKTYLDRVSELFRNDLFSKQSKLYCYFCAEQHLYYKMTGELDVALDRISEALNCYQSQLPEGGSEIFSAMTNVGAVAWEQGDLKTASHYLREAYVGQRKILPAHHPTISSSLLNMAMLENEIGNFDEGIQYINEFLKVSDTTKNGNVFKRAGAHQILTVSYTGLGNYDEAIKQIKKALFICEQEAVCKNNVFYSRLLTVMSLSYRKMNENKLAHEACSKVLAERMKHLGPDHYLTLIARLQVVEYLSLASEYDEALTKLNEFLPLFKKHNSSDLLWSIYWIKFNIHIGKLDFDEAYEAYVLANNYIQEEFFNSVTFMSDDELNHYIDQRRVFFNELVSAIVPLIELYPRFSILVYDGLLTFKSFELSALRIRNQVASIDSTANVVYQKLKSKKSEYESAHMIANRDSLAIEQLSKEIKVLERQLAEFNESGIDVSNNITWKNVQLELEEDEAAVEFVYYEPSEYSPGYAAIICSPELEIPKLVEVASKAEVDEIINKTNTKTSINDLYSKAQDHATLLIDPILTETPKAKRIYYSPSEDLHLINLQTLAWQSQNGTINNLEFVRLNNTKDVARLGGAKKKIETAGLFGGVIFDYDSTLIAGADVTIPDQQKALLPNQKLRGDRSWPYLSSTLKEIESIQSLFNGVNISTHMYHGGGATEERFYSQEGLRPDVLHIATHGYFFSKSKENNEISYARNPLIRSGLLMANANYAWNTGLKYDPELEDGILTAYEISLMDLSNTELVVLSACETGLGDVNASEGVYGLQRAFKIAGVDNIIMSLWQVPDYHTKELMIQFYENWLTEKMSIRGALAAAQKSLRDEGYEPFYWAGFVLLE